MNQVHKVIWSRVKNCYIVVSEITKRVGRDNKASVTGIRPLRALLCAMVIAGCMLPADADAANGLIHAGTGATASGDSSIAYGYSAEAKKEHSIAQGTKAKAEEEYALAMGYQANAKGLQSLAIGKGAIAKGNNSIAEGAGAKGYAKDGIAIGNNAESGTADNKDPRIPSIESNNGVAVGNSAKASGGSSVSVGNDSIGNGPSSVAIGNAATANDVRTTAIGNNAHAEGAGSLSIGREASALTLENATSTNPLVTGTDEQLDRKGVMAIGDDAKASGNNSIALGTSAKAGDLEKTRNADSVTLTGSAKRITKLTTKRSVNNAVAIGTESSVQSDEDIAVGYRATTVASKYHQLPGSGQVAIGSNSNTYGSRGDVAIGSGAETNIRVKNVDHTNGPTEKRDAQSVAIGSVAKAYGSQAVAVGADTRAIGNSSVAIGTDDIELDRTKLETLLPGLANNENLNNKAPNDTTLGSAALGDKPYYVKTASIGTASVALGAMSQAAGDASMAMGLNALAEGDASTAIGPLARSKGKNSIAMGVSAQAAGGKGNTAIGHKAKVESAAGDGNIAFGSSASVKDGAGHVVIGKNASANTVNGYGIAIGSSASIGIGAAADAAAIGTGSRVEGSGIAFGRQAQVTASSTESGIAIGTESSVDGAQKGTAIGYKAKVLRSGDDSGLAIGTESSAGGNEGSIALGKKASVDSSTNAGGVAIGLNASAKGISSIVIGKDAKADDGNQAHVIAIGVGATATGTSQYSSVMGSAAKASREYSTVLGSNANSEVDGGVALGANSISNRHAGGSATGDVRTTNPYIPAGAGAAQVNAINATKGTTGAVSVGSDTVKRQIINVAAGTDDSDAVNVAQLKAVTSNASWTVQGNGSDVNAVKNGSKVNFADGTNTTASVTKDASGKVTAVKYNLKKDVNLGTDGSLTINGNTYINKDGINAGNKQITNVASGGDVVTNAANIGDINRIVTAKDKYITKGKATYQTNGDGTATLTGTNGLSANVTGLKNNYVTSGSVSNDGKTLTLERNDTGKVNVDLSKIFTEVAKEDYHLVANPEAGSQGKYKADSNGNMVLTVANEKGEKKQVTLTDIASKAQQNTNTTNITNINNTIAKGLNFKGDDATVINKKLGEQLDIKGGADASKLTDGNIGVVSGNGALNVKLAKDVTGLNSVTAGTARMGVDSADHKSYVTGLDNRDWDVQNPVVVNGRAATEDQLKKVSDAISTTTAAKTDFRLVKNPDAADGNYSVANGKVDLKVEDKAHPTTPASTVTINNIASASDVEKLKAGFKVKAGTNEGAIKAGETLEFAAKDNAGVEYDPAARKLTVSVSKDPTFNSVTVGDVKINNTGINAGNKQITNVASGGNTTTNAANIGDINRIVEAKDKYVTDGTANYQTNGDGTAALTGTNNLTAKITGLKNNYVTTGSVSNDGKTLTLERNDTGKVNVDLSKIFTEVAKEDYHLVANPEAGSQGKYKADSNGNMVLTVANEKGEKKQVTLTDIASKAQQNTNTTNITNINNTIAKGLNFGGDSGADINKKLGEKLEIKGGASADLTDGNIGVVSDGAKLNVKLKKDVNLGADGSLTINGKTYINKNGLNANNQKITNVEKGTAGTDAVNVDQLNAAIGGTAKATTVKAKDANVTVTEGLSTETGGKEYTVGLGDKVTLGTADKKIVVDGTSGKITAGSKVTIDGTTGDIQAGTVKVTGAGTVNELTNRTWDIDNPTVVHGQAATEDQLKTVSDGVKTNKTNITNINNTIGKGLNFGGDSGAVINKKLGEKLEIKGGASADLTDGNIGVVSDGTKLNVKLKKDVDLGPNGSLTINGKIYVNKDGLNANSQKITNVADGTANSDAVNLGQLNAAIGGTAKATTVKAKDANVTVTEGLSTETGGKEYTVGLGDKVTLGTADKKIVVDGTSGKITAGSKVTIDGTTGDIQAGTVKVTGAGTVNELTNRTWDIDNPTIVHGQAATEDQLKTVSDGVKTNKTNITNINNTIGKGLNFGGDSGAVINKKLGDKLEIKGGASADLTDDNIGVVSDGTKLNVKLKKDVNLGPDGSLTINGKTYVNKDGLNANGQKITNVANGTVNSDAVNFGQLKDAVAAGKTILKDGKNTTVEGEGTVANPYKVNVNDDLVLGKKGADGKDGSIGVNGKDGSAVVINGKDGSIGLNGKDGANGLTIKGGDGKPGVDGTNITRLIIEEKNGKQHDIATLDDGMKYGGDTGDVIKKKLNGQVNVVGGIGDEGKLTTDDNIGVVSDGSNNLKVRLAKNINLGPDGSLTINGKTYVNKDGLNANSQKITNVADGTADSDAVNFGQLKDAVAAGKTILKDGKNTTVEGEGTVANPYKVNVNDDLVLGKKGADGKDGSIGVNGKDGSSVVTHGKDGISIKGKDGKDGVTLKAKDGANGTEGQIGLTGPAGKDGRSTHADIGVNAGPASLDPAKNLSATEMTRLYYVDEKGDHQVATMDDGMKFAGNTGLAIKKLNSTMTIRGTGTKADTEYDPSNIKTMVDTDGNMIVGLDKNLKADSVGINGKDGRDGATIKGGDGKPGVDGTNITRLIIEEKNGKQHDIATLDDGMKYGGDTGAVIKKKLNEQVNVVGGITNKDELTTDDNIGVVSDGRNNLKIRLAKDLKGLNSVTTGNTVMNNDGLTIKNGPKIVAAGIDAGGKKITNVAAGEADTDAVNFSQLKNQGSEIVNKGFGIKAEDGNEVKKKLGETVDVVGDGKNISTRVEGGRVKVALKDDISLNSVTTGRTKMDTNGLTIQDGSGNTAVTVNKDGLKIKDGPSVTKSGIDAGGKKITNVAAGEADTDAVNVSQLKKAAAGATTKVADGKNTTVTFETNRDGSKTYHVNLNDDITLGTDSSKQISIKGSEGTVKAGQVTVNGTAGTVNGLTNKTWDPNNITSGQAATEDQLKVVSGQAGKHSSVTAGSNISVTTGTNANGGTDYKVSVVDTPTFKTVTTGNTVMSSSGLTIKNGPSITQTGVDAGGKRITNVAAGKADTDAVNVGQLKQIGGAINKVDNRINRVGAGAAALAALHPLDFDPDDKWDFTLGYGNYKDAHSLALGAFYRPNEDTMISVGGSIGGGENMVNAGLSMKLGQGNHVSTSKVAMAKEIKDLRAELENVKGALLKVADGRPLDSMDMDKMQLFPDVPENHWAYDYVATLAGNGVIVGYPDGQFGGDRMMTRYEMAALIYRAMQNGAAADDRMARALKEFEPELERIRVDTISKHKDGTPDIQRVRVIKGRG